MRQELWEARWAEISKANHLRIEEAAAFLGIDKNTVSTYRRRFGFTKPKPDIGPIRECSEEGLTRELAAEKLGVPKSYIDRVARQYGLSFRHASAKLDDERADAMASMYRAGKTLEEIGKLYGLTRERVRQLIKKYHGITGKDGGQASLSRSRREKRNLERDARFLKSHGCTYAQYRNVRAISKKMLAEGVLRDRTPLNAFSRQKTNAGKRGIGWNLSLWQWWTIWQQSGKWEKRGRNKDCYVMCRYGDTGAYEIGNVYIATVAHNIKVQPNNPYRKSHPDYERAMADKIARSRQALPEARAA